MAKILNIFHGSDKVVSSPRFNFGKPDNDYGRGFYCTKQLELAREWACQRDKDGFVNSFSLDVEGLKILRLNSGTFSVLHWLSLLVQNREVDDLENQEAVDFLKENYSVGTSNYDIIIGYRADDSYFTFARDFLNDAITLESLTRAMALGKLGLQLMVRSEEAFRRLKFLGAEKVPKDIYYGRYRQRDQNARNAYQELRKAPKSSGIIITEIIKNPDLLEEFELRRKANQPKSKDDDYGCGR